MAQFKFSLTVEEKKMMMSNDYYWSRSYQERPVVIRSKSKESNVYSWNRFLLKRGQKQERDGSKHAGRHEQ